MLLTLIIILILVWAAVVWSIYSYLMVFYSNFSESENYHKAYYASISAVERWELVTKQRSPWYIWSGGFIMWQWTWSAYNSNWWSDGSLSGFSYLWNNAGESSVFWTINSRTTRIPSEWNWDVEWLLSTGDSSDYNMMWYENAEVFLLYYDKSEGNPYSWWNIGQSAPSSISWEIRLPKLLSWVFWPLDESRSLVWTTGQLPKNDAIVDWQIRGIDNDNNVSFIVYPTQAIKQVWVAGVDVNSQYDSIFRESDINTPLKFNFWNGQDPITNSSDPHWQDARITVVGSNSNALATTVFKNIFKKENVSLRFSLLNLLKASDGGHVYPFLEYYADFWTDVSDKYYTIDGEWNFKDFQVNTVVRKPTVKDTVLWNFTSIF